MIGGVTPANERQKQLLAALESADVDVVGAFGPSGTGKSFVTCLYGIKAVSEGRYSRFVIARPLVDVSSGRRYSAVELGNLFFDIASSYLYDLTAGVIGEDQVRKLLSEGKILFADPSFLMGRTFDKSLILLDDAQYVPPEVVHEALLRVGNASKLVIAGDPVFQVTGSNNGAALAREILLGQERTFVVDFGIRDIVRPGAKRAFKLALEAKMRARSLSEEEKKLLNLIYVHAPDAQVITVVDLRPYKEKHGVKTSPDALVISKENYLGRLIGKGGERIRKVEEESGLSLRGVELTLDLKQLIVAIHPVGWIRKYVNDADVVGVNLEVEVDSENFGAFVGQKGVFVRFLDEVMRNLLGIGIRAKTAESAKEEKKERRKRKARK
ncbi:MAG: PhoH family protein [Thermofilum sp.]|nr:PhoH family protein [Thermofilum sp.]